MTSIEANKTTAAANGERPELAPENVGMRLSYSPSDIVVGASFGNRSCYARTGPDGSIDHLFVAALGRWFFGHAGFGYFRAGRSIAQDEIIFEAADLLCRFSDGSLRVEQRTFVPWGDASCVYIWASIANDGELPVQVLAEATGILHAKESKPHRRQPSDSDRRRRFTLLPDSSPDAAALQVPEGDVLVLTASRQPAPEVQSDGTWRWSESVALSPGEKKDVWLCLAASSASLQRQAEPAPAAFAQTQASAKAYLRSAQVGTPSAYIDAACGWGRMNTYRVSHEFAHGVGFNNDPPGSVLVTRDAGWFAFGADYFMPSHCRAMLDTITRSGVYPDGKIAEYLDMNSSPTRRHDYGLNIADPLPLYLLGVHHHASATGDFDWLKASYPVVRDAARYLVDQLQDGLVICASRLSQPGVGQCGWRNILHGVRITGAVTELQAECTAAMAAAAGMARAMSDLESAELFSGRAAEMLRATTEKLVDPETGRYRLALDVIDGADPSYGRDDTLDQIFPMLFGLAPADVASRTVEHILKPAYKTEFGLRTVSKDEPSWEPTSNYCLMGGIWPNATGWAAVAMAPYAPQAAAELMETLARQLFYRNPSQWGAYVPGQFSEWFDGITGISQGMALSPWMPPSYLWIVIEGLFGVRPTLEGLAVKPHLPDSWPGAFLRNLDYRGRKLSLLVTPDAVYSTEPIIDCDRIVCEASDVTGQYTDSQDGIVLESGGTLVAYALSHARDLTFTTPFQELKAGQVLQRHPSGSPSRLP